MGMTDECRRAFDMLDALDADFRNDPMLAMTGKILLRGGCDPLVVLATALVAVAKQRSEAVDALIDERKNSTRATICQIGTVDK